MNLTKKQAFAKFGKACRVVRCIKCRKLYVRGGRAPIAPGLPCSCGGKAYRTTWGKSTAEVLP